MSDHLGFHDATAEDAAGARELARVCEARLAAGIHRAANSARLLVATAKGTVPGCAITDEAGLTEAASVRGIATDGRPLRDVAVELAETVIARVEQPGAGLAGNPRAPMARRLVWSGWRNGSAGGGGGDWNVDAAVRAALCAAVDDGWGASMTAVEIDDILLGTPEPHRCVIGNGDETACEAVVGFSADAIRRVLGGEAGACGASLVRAVRDGGVRGIALLLGPATAREGAGDVAERLIRGDVLVLAVGGPATACARAGLMVPESSSRAGSGLRAVCEQAGCPPVLYMGPLAESPRLLAFCSGFAGDIGAADLARLPIAAICVPARSDRLAGFAIGHCMVASGINTIQAGGFPFGNAPQLRKYLTHDLAEAMGAGWFFAGDAGANTCPATAAERAIELIEAKRMG